MATIVTRAGNGSPLTNTQVDANFTNLNTDKIEATDISVTTAAASGGGSLSYASGSVTFTYTPPDLTHTGDVSGGSALTLTGAAITGKTAFSGTLEAADTLLVYDDSLSALRKITTTQLNTTNDLRYLQLTGGTLSGDLELVGNELRFANDTNTIFSSFGISGLSL